MRNPFRKPRPVGEDNVTPHRNAKLNERHAIITSMNLYDFSQVNNNEMGVLVDRDEEHDLYRHTYEEAQRLIRVSDEVRLAAEKVDQPQEEARAPAVEQTNDNGFERLTTSKLAKALGLRTGELIDKLLTAGLIEKNGKYNKLTDKGKAAGGEFRFSKKFGPYFLWPADFQI